MWGPIIRVIALVGGGLAMGGMMQDPPQVIVHSAPPPPPPPAAVAAAQGLSPMLVVACAILVAAIGYTIWMFRRSS
jgi:hypothetical protein